MDYSANVMSEPVIHQRLSVRGCALAAGLIFAVLYGLLVLRAFWLGTDNVFLFFTELYRGVEASGGGLFIAIVWGFLSGSIVGWFFGYLYNLML